MNNKSKKQNNTNTTTDLSHTVDGIDEERLEKLGESSHGSGTGITCPCGVAKLECASGYIEVDKIYDREGSGSPNPVGLRCMEDKTYGQVKSIYCSGYNKDNTESMRGQACRDKKAGDPCNWRNDNGSNQSGSCVPEKFGTKPDRLFCAKKDYRAEKDNGESDVVFEKL